MPYSITHDSAARRYEIHTDGEVAYEAYRIANGVMAMEHTVVPKALEGRGIGSALVKHVLDDAARQGLKVDPVCSFVKAYIDRHPQYQGNSVAHGTGG